MDLVRNSVSYCCVSKGGQVLYSYNNGDPEIENLAALCLEKTPPYHQWYFETMAKKTFGFFIEDECVYFAIVTENLGNARILRFLQKLKDEFRKLGKKGTSKSFSNLNSLCLQEQLLPIVNHLVASLEHVLETGESWPNNNSSQGELTPSPNGHFKRGASTTAPLLGKPGKHGKQEKKIMKDHAIAMRGIEMEEHGRSTERGVSDSNDQETAASPLRKEINSRGIRLNSHNLQKKWCCIVRIVLVIDVAVCVVLFTIWLVICRGIECTR